MYSVKLDENGYYANSYAKIGKIDGGIDTEYLPPEEDTLKASCYKWETKTVTQMVEVPIINQETGLQETNESGDLLFAQQPQDVLKTDWFLYEEKYNNILNAILQDKITAKIKEVGIACKAIIYAGVDVQLSDGDTYHFSMNADDQTNIDSLFGQAVSGLVPYLPYHADGHFCKMFSAADIVTIGTAAMKHKIFHTTLCNYLNMYIKGLTDEEIVDSVTYSAEVLPEEYKTKFLEFIQAAAQ